MQDRPYFQVTSPVLQRLQDVLRHLMAQGEQGNSLCDPSGKGCQLELPTGSRTVCSLADPGARVG